MHNLDLADVYGFTPTEYVSRSGTVCLRKTSSGWIVGLRGVGVGYDDLVGPRESFALALAAYDAWANRPAENADF
jgi:hypothetical protein